jgi:hypothetical protein
MLKVTEQQDAALGSILLRLEGKLAGPWVEELNSFGVRSLETNRVALWST